MAGGFPVRLACQHAIITNHEKRSPLSNLFGAIAVLSIEAQIADGRLVCPFTYQRLVQRNQQLVSTDGRLAYSLQNGVPIFLDQEKQRAYVSDLDGAMAQQYMHPDTRPALIRYFERMSMAGGDYRTEESLRAFHQTVVEQPETALCISVGGGPMRQHPNLVNVNIDLFPNVDVVADAYRLPYANDSVDSFFCEAVLEHLEFPDEAVREMFRSLTVGGLVFAVTPFLQMFHGYPNHYQNYTLVGHRRLFERAGFRIISADVCVGPTFAMLDLLTNYCMFLPGAFLSRWAYRAMRMLSAALRPVDRRFNRHLAASVLASTTYVHAIKP